MVHSPSSRHALRALIRMARPRDPGPLLAWRIDAPEAIPTVFLFQMPPRPRATGFLRSTPCVQRCPGDASAVEHLCFEATWRTNA